MKIAIVTGASSGLGSEFVDVYKRQVCDEKVVLEPEPEYGVRLRKSVIETLDPKKCHRIAVFFQE